MVFKEQSKRYVAFFFALLYNENALLLLQAMSLRRVESLGSKTIVVTGSVVPGTFSFLFLLQNNQQNSKSPNRLYETIGRYV